jgi:hypothetical protein
MVSTSTLIEIFLQLLGKASEIDDLMVEASINLMNKVGPRFEEEMKKTKKKKEDKAKQNDDADEGTGKSDIVTDYNNIWGLLDDIKDLADGEK